MTRDRLVGAGVVAFAVVGAAASVSVFVGGSGLAVRAFLLLFGVGFFAAGVLGAAEAVQRGHQALRFVLTPVRSAEDSPSDTSWVRLTGTASMGNRTVRTAFGEDALAATTNVAKRERFTGVPRPSAKIGIDFEDTESAAFEIDRGTTLALGGDCRVVGGRTETLTAGDDSAREIDAVQSFLRARDAESDAEPSRGPVFEHVLNVSESTVRPGDTVSVFGRVRVEPDGRGSVVRPAGRFENRPLLSTTGWRPVVRRVVRRLLVTAALSVLFLAAGAYLLWMGGVGY
ncbi:hypothetical protein [Halopelagius longus]|uniref:Uncharacterized protein n=1 Tax=Halopelagius longus TaxID=1236180 RepID=A0A1H1BXB1_9EURY|nr:hypothetical protein [Halopelagius longus]RDI70965.1 hypothetical protein DWB78_04060 [Halopelagius longus]SDQ56531.1 hypothetical protein SAMN05216278_2002 [Halopelagius longus]